MRRAIILILSALTWLLLSLTLIAGYARIIPPSISVIPQILCLTLPLLSLAALVAGIIWLCFRRKLMPIASAIVLIAISPSLAEIFPVNFPAKPQEKSAKISLLTYNVHNCQDLEEEKIGSSRALEYVINSGADIVCFQELYSTASAMTIGDATLEQVKAVSRLYPYSSASGNTDVSVISKYPLKLIESEYKPAKGYFMYQVMEVEIPGHPLTLINLHLTSYDLSADLQRIEEKTEDKEKKRMEYLRESASLMKHSLYGKLHKAFEYRAEAARAIAQIVNGIKGDVILCGDFNDVPASYVYNTIRNVGLQDAWLDCRTGPAATFNKYHLYFHIDQVLYRGRLRPYEITVGSLTASDHYPLLTHFELL